MTIVNHVNSHHSANLDNMGTLLMCITLLALLLIPLSEGLVEYTIYEELPVGSLIGDVSKDAKLNSSYSASEMKQLQYSFLDKPDVDLKYFKIEENTGIIRMADSARLDRDEICPHQVLCDFLIDVAIGPAQFFRVINIKITILDMNDNRPKFTPEKIELKISESTLVGTKFSLPIAVDPDSEENGLQRYDLDPWLEEFELKQSIGPADAGDLQLVIRQALDRELVKSYHLRVLASDGGQSPLVGSMQVNVVVVDTNDNAPVFSNDTYQMYIREDTPVDSILLRLRATDPDEDANGEVMYALSVQSETKYGDMFGVDPDTGDIVLLSQLRFETTDTYHLTVTATDLGMEGNEAHATVLINVLDVNDNPPQITINTLTPDGQPQISEFSPEGTFVAHISVLDSDQGKNGEVLCTMDGEGFELEHIGNFQYKVVTATLLDRERRDEYHLSINCHDYGDFSLSTMKELTVTVTDENDHNPQFIQTSYSREIEENNDIDEFILRVSATDDDIGQNGEIRYKLLQDSAGLFKVDPTNGIIRAAMILDYEMVEMIQFSVVAFDQGMPSRSATAIITVRVEDQNDNPPMFALREYSFHIFENRSPIMNIGVVSASDRDRPPFNEIAYDFAPYGSTEAFTINPHTGQIKTSKTLDREEQAVYYLTAMTYNPGYDGVSSSVSITVYVGDENDNAPYIQFPSEANSTILIYNDVPEGFVVTRIMAYDLDFGPNAKLTYDIVEGSEDGTFIMESETGAIIVNKDLKEVMQHQYSLKVIVGDDGDPPRMTWTSLNILVNQSLTSDQGGGGLLNGTNKTIVISLATASAFIVIVLVASILIVKSYDKRNGKNNNGETRHNHIKIEIQRMLGSRKDKDNSQNNSSGDSSNESSFGANSKDINFTMDGGSGRTSNYSQRQRGISKKDGDNNSHLSNGQVRVVMFLFM